MSSTVLVTSTWYASSKAGDEPDSAVSLFHSTGRELRSKWDSQEKRWPPYSFPIYRGGSALALLSPPPVPAGSGCLSPLAALGTAVALYPLSYHRLPSGSCPPHLCLLLSTKPTVPASTTWVALSHTPIQSPPFVYDSPVLTLPSGKFTTSQLPLFLDTSAQSHCPPGSLFRARPNRM